MEMGWKEREGDGSETSALPGVALSPSERRIAVEGKAGRRVRVRVWTSRECEIVGKGKEGQNGIFEKFGITERFQGQYSSRISSGYNVFHNFTHLLCILRGICNFKILTTFKKREKNITLFFM
jgi:hypothetical protein